MLTAMTSLACTAMSAPTATIATPTSYGFAHALLQHDEVDVEVA